eukprot:GHVT01028282.1.p1 GENE.GHVT01028282.1~~GHVT01028282.1.p1  ORF type:complete len:618 (+),score=76.42 GHVT01028282.1:2015-3868(+)
MCGCTLLFAGATLAGPGSVCTLPRDSAASFRSCEIGDDSCAVLYSFQVFCPLESWYQEGKCLKKVIEFNRAECPAGFSNLCSVPQLENLTDCCVRSEIVAQTPFCSKPFELKAGSCSRTLLSPALALCPNERGEKGCVAIETKPVEAVCPVPEVDGQCMRQVYSESRNQVNGNLEFTCPIGYKFVQEASPDGADSPPVGTCTNVVFATRKYACSNGYRLDRQHHLCRRPNRQCSLQTTLNQQAPLGIAQGSGLPKLAPRRNPQHTLPYVTAGHRVARVQDAVAAAAAMPVEAAAVSVACDRGEQVQLPVGRCPPGFVSASELDESLYNSRRSWRQAVAEELCVKRTSKPVTRRCAVGHSCAPVYEAVSNEYACPTGYAFLPASINWASSHPAQEGVCALLGTAPATPTCMAGSQYNEELKACETHITSAPALRCSDGAVKRCNNGWHNQPCECVKQHVRAQTMAPFCPPGSESRAWCRYTPYGHSKFYEALCPQDYDEHACYSIEIKENDLKCANGVMVEKRCVETKLADVPTSNQCGIVKKVDDACVERVESLAICPPGTRMDLTNPLRCVAPVKVAPVCVATVPSTPPAETEENASEKNASEENASEENESEGEE